MSFSGFITAADPAVDPGVFGSDPAYIDANSPAVLVRSGPAAASIYYVLAAGLHDQYFNRGCGPSTPNSPAWAWPTSFTWSTGPTTPTPGPPAWSSGSIIWAGSCPGIRPRAANKRIAGSLYGAVSTPRRAIRRYEPPP